MSMKLARSWSISVVTPTLDRPGEVRSLVDSLARQALRPEELILIDGAPVDNRATEQLVSRLASRSPFPIRYVRRGGGTAIQRNVGIEMARGALIAFIDDDMLLAPSFLQTIADVYRTLGDKDVGGIAGYITNQYLDPRRSLRWRMYRRLRLFSTLEPGRFDFASGYPINRYLQRPHDQLREIDFMGANCAVWRRDVFDEGLRFSRFFVDYGVMEDAHLALSARKRGWRLLECGSAHCEHHHSPRGRRSKRQVARKTAVNYRYLFVDIVPQRSLKQEIRWWRVQLIDLVRLLLFALRQPRLEEWSAVMGKLEGLVAATRVRAGMATPP